MLGSTLPVRFPECLRVPDCKVTPFAIQPGQVLMPESCGVALRVHGVLGGWLGVWRPAERRMRHLPAPGGWLAGAGLWTREGELLLPYATGEVPCGVQRTAPFDPAGPPTGEGEDASGDPVLDGAASAAGALPADAGEPADTDPPEPVVARPVPLQQAPLGRLVTN